MSTPADRKRAREADIMDIVAAAERLWHVDESRRQPDPNERQLVLAEPLPPKRQRLPPPSDARYVGRFGLPLVHTQLVYTQADVERLIEAREEVLYPAYTRLLQEVAVWKAAAAVAVANKTE